MKQKNLYEILGVSRTASDDEIKKAFRKLSLELHPDRQGGKSDKEKKEAEDKFKEVSAAYSILSDPAKKHQYDTFGTIDGMDTNMDGFDLGELLRKMSGGFGNMFGGFGDFFGSHRSRPNTGQQVSKGTSIRMQIQVGIEEILNGRIDRDIKYDIDARCPECQGKGGESKEICNHCHGTGYISKVTQTPFGYMQQEHPCEYCNGTGFEIKNKCKKCKGTGFVRREASVHLNVSNFHDGQQYMFAGKGYESVSSSLPNGDLLLELRFVVDPTKFVIDNSTIYEKIEVPYYDCILGTKLEHKLPNGKKITLNIPAYTQEGKNITTIERFNGMSYIAIVHVKIPTYIRDKEKELLEQLRKENQ